jgi:twitching motility two-component system response regulator PilH
MTHPHASAPSESDVALKGRVLIVDDSPSERLRASKALKKAGWEVLERPHASDVVDVASQWAPAVILMDVLMAPTNGYEACRALRASAMTKNIPIIMCTVKHSATDWVWARQQGASAYLVKPWTVEQLLAEVEKLVPGAVAGPSA